MQIITTANSGVAAIAKFAALRKEVLLLDMVGLLGLFCPAPQWRPARRDIGFSIFEYLLSLSHDVDLRS